MNTHAKNVKTHIGQILGLVCVIFRRIKVVTLLFDICITRVEL